MLNPRQFIFFSLDVLAIVIILFLSYGGIDSNWNLNLFHDVLFINSNYSLFNLIHPQSLLVIAGSGWYSIYLSKSYQYGSITKSVAPVIAVGSVHELMLEGLASRTLSLSTPTVLEQIIVIVVCFVIQSNRKQILYSAGLMFVYVFVGSVILMIPLYTDLQNPAIVPTLYDLVGWQAIYAVYWLV